jgi:stage V sporulation protein AE
LKRSSGENKAEVKNMDYLWAFLIGGAICAIGQVLIDFTKLTPARILVLFVTLGVALTGLGLYGPLVDFAGAGATVPLTGFGYLMAKGTLEAVREQGLLGAFTGGVAASAAGIAAAVFFGYVAALFSKSGDKS